MSGEAPQRGDGVLGWFARNGVAAHMLMLTLVVGGLLAFLQTKQEVFPSLDLDIVNVQVVYPGASPEEIEEGILLPVESAVQELEDIKRISAVAREGLGTVTLELADGADRNAVLQDVRGAVDTITTFPEDAEEPGVFLAARHHRVMKYGVYGPMPESVRYELADNLHHGLIQLPEVTQVRILGVRDPEITVEIDDATLRSLGLTLSDVAREIQRNGMDIPGGGIRTDSNELLLRATGRRDMASELANIPLLNRNGGGLVLLGDVATLRDGFADVEQSYRINGQPAFAIGDFKIGDTDPMDAAAAIKRFFDEAEHKLPDSIGVVVLDDVTVAFSDRVEMLLDNGTIGFLLVLLMLSLFLAPRLAFWVAAGIPISMIGAFVLLPETGATVNMISLFAFILVLGIVVDDAIIVGESIFQRIEQGMSRIDAAVAGVREMLVPVLLAVSTNIIAFLPLLLAPGTFGQLLSSLPKVAICVFSISLVEALLILPAHIGHGREGSRAPRGPLGRLAARIDGMRSNVGAGFLWVRDRLYAPALDTALANRLVTVSLFIGGLVLIVAWTASGRLPVQFAPAIEGREVEADLVMAQGVPFQQTEAVAERIEAAGLTVAERMGAAERIVARAVDVGTRGASNQGQVVFNMGESEGRPFSLEAFAKAWRQEVGSVPDVESLSFNYKVGPGGRAAIAVELSHSNRDVLRGIAAELARELGNYRGVTDIDDGFTPGKPQLDFTLTPEAKHYGLTIADLGRQLRDRFEGAEALRQLRNRDEVRIKVRPPEDERRSLAHLDDLVLQLPGGGEIPLAAAADIDQRRAAQEIERLDGKGVVTVSANVVPGVGNANAVQEALAADFLPELIARYPGLSWEFGGQMRDQKETMQHLMIGLVACLAGIFALLSSVFRSYLQGTVVMLTIPFSIGAALLGHVVLGYTLSVMSMFGVIALTGLVINGSQVLMLKINDEVGDGASLTDAIRIAAINRFRPIVLTYLTTTVGLMPLLFETSIQARFLIPMAIALSFGTLFSAFVVLLFIPSLLLLLKRGLADEGASAPRAAFVRQEG